MATWVRVRGEKDYIWTSGWEAMPVVKMKNTVIRVIWVVKNPRLGNFLKIKSQIANILGFVG